VPRLALSKAVVKKLEVEQHEDVLQGARQAGDELPGDVRGRKLEHVLNRGVNLLEVLVHDPTQAFRVLLESLGDQRRVEEQMDAALSAVEQPLRMHAVLPRPAPSGRALFGLCLLIGRQGREIESALLHESCR